MAFTADDASAKSDDRFTSEFWHTRSSLAPLGFKGKVEKLATLIGAATRNVDRGKNVEASYKAVMDAAMTMQNDMKGNLAFRKLYLGPQGKHIHFYQCVAGVAKTAMSRAQNFTTIDRTKKAINDGSYRAAGKEQEKSDSVGGSWADPKR